VPTCRNYIGNDADAATLLQTTLCVYFVTLLTNLPSLTLPPCLLVSLSPCLLVSWARSCRTSRHAEGIEGL